MTRFRTLNNFVRRTDGALSIESILTLPMLAWALMACFSYFDALRQANVNIKATHTMGDLLSRESDGIDAAYMDGMHDVLRFLVRTNSDPRMRVTVVEFDGTDNAFELKWSETRGGGDPITEGTLATLTPRLPEAFGGAQLIIVETATDYSAPFVLGLGDTTLQNLVVTRPRFTPTLKWGDGEEDGAV